MSNTNAVLPFLSGNVQELADTIGITQFPAETSWFQTIGGLLIQGGKVAVLSSATLAVPFHAGYPTQVLGVFLQVIDAAENGAFIPAPTLDSFSITNGVGDRTYFWWSIGV